MERHVQVFLNRLSLVFVAIATALLLSIFLRTTNGPTPATCNSAQFPRSTCSPSLLGHRSVTTISKKNHRLWSTSAWISSVKSFSLLFHPLLSPPISVLSNSSKAVSLLSGAGQEVMALHQIGIEDVIGIDLVDSPPLVSHGDLYNLPFFDGAFDFAFSAQFDVVLFPVRFIAEMERLVRVGGHCVLVISGDITDQEVKEIAGLFQRGKMVGMPVDVVLNGSKTRRITVKILSSDSPPV